MYQFPVSKSPFNECDLGSNPFFIELQTKYAKKYREAQKHQGLICVPHYKCFSSVTIDKEFVDFHVLKPSPFFKSHYVTTDDNSSMSIELEDSTLKTPSGDVIKILTEETAYNERFKKYKILLIERPLTWKLKNKEESQTESTSGEYYFLSQKECTVYLESLPNCTRSLELLDKKLHAFNSSYLILTQYLQDAATKLQNISQWSIKEFLCSLHFSPPKRISRIEMSIAIENYIMYNTHDSVFPVIKKHCMDEDKKLTEKLLSLYAANITPDQLGVGEAFCCQTPSAVVELASLNSRCSPAEKLYCLVTTLELLNQDVEKYLNDTCLVVNKDVPHLTSDDLIPLLVNVIIQARPQYFVSNLYYMQNFCWELSSVDKFSFVLVTFQAAKEFLMSNEFNFPETSARKVRKELSLEELMEAAVEFQNNPKSPSESKPLSNQASVDHQLENIMKKIEASTQDLPEKSHFRTESVLSRRERQSETVERVKEEENLGDFIQSLRQKSLGLTYGKQA